MKLSPEKQAAVLATYDKTGSIRKAADRNGVAYNTAARLVHGRPEPAGDDAPAVVPFTVKEADGGAAREVEGVSDRKVVTLEDALAFAQVDPSVWRVKDWECSGWTTTLKLTDRDARGKPAKETPVQKQNWRVKVRLERVAAPPTVLQALDAVVARLEKCPPAPAAVRLPRSERKALAVVDLVDVHFGKLAWAAETSQNYDLKIADRVYREAVRELLGRCGPFQVEEFVMPLGSDFLHIDNAAGTTTAGTPQDVDGRLAKIMEVAELAAVYAVDEMAARGRVRVVWVPGNHDRVLSYMLARIVAARFHGRKDVAVDVTPTTRKYHRYSNTLIGFTHGDQERPASLPTIMSTERPGDWAETTCREWHIGHLHKSKKVDHLSLDTHGGVPVRTLRSLSAVDAWHYRSGYVGTQRAAEMYLYEEGVGLVANFYANVREPAAALRKGA